MDDLIGAFFCFVILLLFSQTLGINGFSTNILRFVFQNVRSDSLCFLCVAIFQTQVRPGDSQGGVIRIGNSQLAAAVLAFLLPSGFYVEAITERITVRMMLRQPIHLFHNSADFIQRGLIGLEIESAVGITILAVCAGGEQFIIQCGVEADAGKHGMVNKFSGPGLVELFCACAELESFVQHLPNGLWQRIVF